MSSIEEGHYQSFHPYPTTSPPISAPNGLGNDPIRPAEYDAQHEARYFAHVEVPEQPYMIPLPNYASKQSSIDLPRTQEENGGQLKQKTWAKQSVELLSCLAKMFLLSSLMYLWKNLKLDPTKHVLHV